MSCIHYKFKTTLDYRSISFDGVALSLADLKKAIFQQRRMKPGEIDLEITNAQTKEVYKNNDDMIPKNSSVIVARVPIPTSTKNNTSKSWEAFKQECARAIKQEKEKERAAQELANQQAGDIANAKTSEIDKIRAMMNQSGRDFDPASYKNKVPLGQPPVGYKCYKCGKGGHYIHGCTEKSESNVIEPKFKRSTGIPNSFLTLTDDPTVPGALLTYSGKFAVPTIDKHAYATGKKELPPFLPGMNTQAVVPKSPGIPQELRCLICQDLLKDAVLIPCCGNSFCDDCIRNKLLETEDHECPVCHEQDVSPDKLIPNMLMRKAIINFLNESGYTNAINKSVERMKEERRSASPTMPPASTPQVQAPPVQKPVQAQKPVNIRQAWQQYKKPTYNQVIQTLTPSQPNIIPRIVPVTQQIPSIQQAPHHFTNTISSVNRVVNDAIPVQTVTRSQPPPLHMTSIPVQSVNSPILSQHSERSNTPEDRAPTPVKDEQPHPPGVDEATVNVISVVGQPPPEVQTVQAVQTTRSSTVPSWQNLKAPGSNTPPLYGSLPPTTSNSHPPSLLGVPPPIYPGVPGPMIGQPITPMNFGVPPFGSGPRPPFPPFAPPVAPMSKEQFYREQKRMKEAAKEKKYDVMDHFTKDFLERKDRVKKTKSKSKSHSRSRSKTPRRSRSRTPRRLRSLTPRRSRSRSRPPRSLTPIRKRSRSRTPYRSRSRSRSPPPRLRTRSRSRSRYRSRSRSRYRSRSRSFARSLSRGRYRSYSRSPIRSYRKYSRSRSRSPYRRYSPVRRRSPIGSRRRSLTPPGSPSYRGKYPESRRWSPRPGARYGNDSPGRYSPPPRYPPDYGFSGPPGPPPFGFDGPPPPPHFFGNPPGYGIGPRPPLGPPGMPVGLPPPPPGFAMYPAPPVPPIRNRSRSPKRHGRPLMGTPPRGRYDHDRPRDRKDYGTDRASDRPRTHDDKGRYQRDGYGRKDYPKTQDGVRSHDKERNSQTSDSNKTSKDKKGKEDKENKENGKGLKSDEKTEKEKSKEKGDSKSKKKKESKKKEKSEKKKRDKSKDKKKVETDISGDVDKYEEKKDSTKVSTGNTYTRSSNSTLIFLTGGGDEAPEKSEANTAETTTDATYVKKDTEPSPAKDIKKIKKVKKRSKSCNVAEDTSDSTTENKSRTRSSKKAAALVEYNETSGDVSDKPPKKKGTSKKGKAKGKEEESKQEDAETPSKDPDGIRTKVEKENNESGNEVATLVNRAPPSPHDQVPSSPIDATDGVHEDEPSPPGVNDKPDLLLDKPDLLLDKPELMLDLPELSKWERDDIDEESEEEPQKIEVKKSLPKSVIEKAEKALTQKPPKISSVASAITSPVRNTGKKRRVYLDEGEDEKKPVESYEDNRRVHTKQKSMQITISSKERQRNEELERREMRKGDKSRREEKRDREPERKSVFTRMKLDDHERNSDKYKDRRDRESRSSFEDSSNRKDRESRKIKDLREKLPNRTDRRDHERFEEQRERHREKPSRRHSDSNHKDNDIGKGSSDKSRTVNSKSVKDCDDHSDQELNETRNTNEKTESKSKPVIDRKESLLDESLFEPDYNEEVSETETSSTDEAPGKVQKEKEPSPSASSRESSPTPAKKRKRHDTTDDENPSKKSKHKKHKHKHKTGKHKHKKKKHKKKEQETE
ncbi:E3 ubiquitin-protein ligase RBBP6 isoform X2 [Patella vulgata]|uniref:E3 ubiquitin-protein ligase RBBP6 isoform X2 n=1 Tax=Patella vulgata TaxID=6465 RepID=UPI00217F99CD|nr:E3 ubiquitin-protein ligase RBBP6 isoform X2 [Patella vulgata]